MSGYRIVLGRRGEELAAAYLTGLGLRLRHRNYRSAVGEIDLIATADDGTLIFVEVRTRLRTENGINPLDAVNQTKQNQVRRTVQAYLDHIRYRGQFPVRIDVIGLTFTDDAVFLRHIPDAF